MKAIILDHESGAILLREHNEFISTITGTIPNGVGCGGAGVTQSDDLLTSDYKGRK